MERRPLGRTGITLPRLSFGASPLGDVFGTVAPADADAAVRRAIDLGIDCFDTSPFYGLGRSETVLGRGLRGIARDRYLLSTKVGRYGPDDFDFSTERVRASIDESLGRLGVDHVDLLIAHDIEYGDPRVIVEETLPVLRAAVAAGKARAIGISGYPLGIFPWVAERFPVDFVLSYAHLTLQDRTLAPWLDWFSRRGIGVIDASPLGMGLLTRQGPPAWHPAPSAVHTACRNASVACEDAGIALADVAMAWSARQEGVATTLVGMADAATVERNHRAASPSARIDPPPIAAAHLASVRDLGWTSGHWGAEPVSPDQLPADQR